VFEKLGEVRDAVADGDELHHCIRVFCLELLLHESDVECRDLVCFRAKIHTHRNPHLGTLPRYCGAGDNMTITCAEHGEVEAIITKDFSAYCPTCWAEAVKKAEAKFKDMTLTADPHSMSVQADPNEP
jgi:hypothetical protein